MTKLIDFSIVANNKSEVTERFSMQFSDIVERFESHYEKSKEKQLTKDTVRAIIPAHFERNTRKISDLIKRTMLTLDIDEFAGFSDQLYEILQEELKDYEYYYYTTASNIYSSVPKLRVLLPLATPLPADEYRDYAKRYVEELKRKLGAPRTVGKEVIDDASTRPAQLMYLPFFNGRDDFESYRNKGKYIELSTYRSVNLLQFSSNNNAVELSLSNDKHFSMQQIHEILRHYRAADLDYHKWLEVGMAFHANFNGSDEGLAGFTKWSKLDDRTTMADRYENKTIEQVCKEKYKSFKITHNNPLNFATIAKRSSKDIVRTTTHDVAAIGKVPDHLWIHYDEIVKKTYTQRKPIATYENFLIMLQHYNIQLRYDVIKKSVKAFVSDNELTDANDKSTEKDKEANNGFIMNFLTSLTRLNKIAVSDHGYAINAAYANQYNSFKDFVTSKNWDGVSRIQEFLETVEVEPKYLSIRDLYIKKWLLQAIHVTCLNYGRGKQARQALIFKSNQMDGKTTWLANIVPVDYQKDFVATCMTLNTSDSMSILSCIQHVFVELGETGATFKKSDTEEMKSFLSKTTDILNRKYIGEPQCYKRRTVFFGSVNDETFLHDDTGSTRFLVLPIVRCNGYHNIDMQQVFAELYVEAQTNDAYELTVEERELQAEVNAQFELDCHVRNAFNEFYDPEAQHNDVAIYANAEECLISLGYEQKVAHTKQTRVQMIKVFRAYKLEYNTFTKKYKMPPRRYKK